MANFRYISDNPYRLLAIGSSVTQRELRQKATATEMAAKVGMAPESGLTQVFGSEEICHCANIVKALANDPEKRTIYRLFWPFIFQLPSQSCETLETFNQLLDTPSDNAAFHATHLSFLVGWFNFTVTHTPQRLVEALNAFEELYNDADCDLYLQSLLEADGIESDNSMSIVYEAQRQTIAVLLNEGCRAAIDAWNVQDYQRCFALLQAVIDSGFDEDAIDKALIEIVPTGDREMATIQTAINGFEGWSPEDQEFDACTLEPLRQLALAVQGHILTASLWLDAVETRVMQIANSMRDYAIALANEKDDYKQCVTILVKIRSLLLPEDFRQQIEKDIAQATQLKEDQEVWADILPMDGLPSLSTINGIGCCLYGHTQFTRKPGWYFTTLYFVVLYIPIIPIERFLVSDAPDGGWYFHGSTRLSKSNKIHLWVSVALIVAMVLYGIVSANRATPDDSSQSYGDTPPITAPSGRSLLPSLPSDQSTAEAKQARIKRLEAEYDKLKPEVGAEDNSLKQEKERLQQRKSALVTEGDTLNTYDGELVDHFNAKARKFNRDKERFNRRVGAYNAKVKRLNQIVQALKETGE